MNDSRSLVLQVSSFAGPAASGAESAVRTLAYRQIAWCCSLGQTLRDQDPLAGLQQFLPAAELAYVGRHANKPLALLALHNEQVRGLFEQQAINAFQQVTRCHARPPL